MLTGEQRRKLVEAIDVAVRRKQKRKQRGTYHHEQRGSTRKSGGWIPAIEKVQRQHIFDAMVREYGGSDVLN